MCTSVPHTPARRTRINTSSSRMVGSGTSHSRKPGPADCLTRAFIEAKKEGDAEAGVTSHRPMVDGSERVKVPGIESEGVAREAGQIGGALPPTDALLPLVYAELKEIARAHRRTIGGRTTLCTTEL